MIQSLGIEFGSKKYFLNSRADKIVNFLKDVILNLLVLDQEIENRYGINTTSGWQFSKLRKKEMSNGFLNSKVKKCTNAPFDTKYTYHSDILRRPQRDVLYNLYEDNIAFINLRQSRVSNVFCYFLVRNIFSKDAISILDRATGFPLYLYPEVSDQQLLDNNQQRTPNLNMSIVKQITVALGLTFTSETETIADTFAPIDLLDYIYAVLHSPAYREKFKRIS